MTLRLNPGVLTWLFVLIALLIGTIGAVSVFNAIYIDRRELNCACVGGASNVPLGFVSVLENLMMVAMAIWVALAALGLVAGAHGLPSAMPAQSLHSLGKNSPKWLVSTTKNEDRVPGGCDGEPTTAPTERRH